jgi:hypothetical protein
VTRLGAGRLGNREFDSQQAREICLLSIMLRRAVGPTNSMGKGVQLTKS